MSRLVALMSNGRFVAIRRQGQVAIIDAYGTEPERRVSWDGHDLAFVGEQLWLLEEGEVRYMSPVDRSVSGHAAVEGSQIVARGDMRTTAAVIGGGGRWSLVTHRGDHLVVGTLRIDDGLRPLDVHDQRILAAGDACVAMVQRGGDILWHAPVPEGAVVGGAVLFAGRAVAVHVRTDSGDVVVVLREGGQRLHVIAVPKSDVVAYAAERGIAILAAGDELHRVELRWGRAHGVVPSPLPASQLLLDEEGRYLLAAGSAGSGPRPPVLHIAINELFPAPRGAALHRQEPVGPESVALEGEPDRDLISARNGAQHRCFAAEFAAVSSDGAASRAGMAELSLPDGPAFEIDGLRVDAGHPSLDAPDVAAPPASTITIPDLVPLALGEPRPRDLPRALATRDDIFVAPRQHLRALLDLTLARTGLAIADGWNSGRLSSRSDGTRPFEREVDALVGDASPTGGFAQDRLERARRRLSERNAQLAERVRCSLAAGVRLPFLELTHEFDLNPTAALILITVMAPALRGEIARLYGVLANDPTRPLCDRYLVEMIVGADANDVDDVHDRVVSELSAAAPLVRYGLVRVGPAEGGALFAPLTVDEVLLERVRGAAPRTGALGTIGVCRTATAQLDELHVSRTVLRDLVLALSRPCPPGAPLRLVLRGRRGSGRHTIACALAARVRRDVVCIDCGRLPRAPGDHAEALASELLRALLRDSIPVVSDPGLLDPSDAPVRHDVREVLRTHPGPLVVRTNREAAVPLDPGYLSVVLPPLVEGERVAVWQEALARHQLTGVDAEWLAGRYRLGPGEVEKVVSYVAERDTARPNGDNNGDRRAAVDRAARQHVSARLDHVATRVRHLAGWDQLILPDDMLDSLREFVGRARHRRTVYERWGYDKLMTSSRGLTALFYGSPGTGKSMVAGVIAQELGLELYRVDLARVVSKWLGETEKNLAAVFDAADDGQVLVLFDEADALFTKRTDVRTANDRYANLEVNYLLQRLDSFEGIAILTSNLEGAIDQAFKRRLSLRLFFPFPDEDMRARLWEAHVPPRLRSAAPFDFDELARRFPLSGGYIRNCTLRAAFLAAQEERPLSQNHLLRAVHLEYRELGKLSTTSRIE